MRSVRGRDDVDSTHNAGGNESGASLIEFTLLLPLFVVLLFGTIEMGLALRNQLTMSNAVTSSARIGSVLGTDLRSDIAVLDAVEAGLVGAVDPTVISRVVIYESDLTGSSTGSENHYLYDPTDPTCPWSPCPDPSHPSFTGQFGNPSSWAPDTRDATLPDPDIIGVQIQYQHQWVTTVVPFMSAPANWNVDARLRLEPDVYGSTTS